MSTIEADGNVVHIPGLLQEISANEIVFIKMLTGLGYMESYGMAIVMTIHSHVCLFSFH